MCSYIQVNVNGQHIFFLDERILSTYSNRVRNLATEQNNGNLIFNDFPGGAEVFELITSFCYNNGTIDITPSNIFLLHTGSTFMEIKTLILQTDFYLESIHCFTWTEFIDGLRQCQTLFPFMKKSPNFKYFLNTLLKNLALPEHLSTSCPSSSNNSNSRFSSSDKSPKSSRSTTDLDYWKFEDLFFLNIDIFEELIKSMIFLNFDHPRICSFIFHYQKVKFSICCAQDQRCKISETNINLLSLLNGSAFSCRALLDVFGMCLCLNMKTREKSKLENLLGSRLDEFEINDLIVRGKKKVAFDVDLTLGLIKIFLLERRINGFFMHRVKKVGVLMDLFMFEVAPDRFLKHSKFLALAMALPDFSRDSHDRMYHAMDLYVQIHPGLCKEQTIKIWSVVDINKLSTATAKIYVAKNTKLLPFVRQNQFKIFIKYDYAVKGFHQCEEKPVEDEKRDPNITKKTRRLMSKKPRTLNPCSVRSLPRLCH